MSTVLNEYMMMMMMMRQAKGSQSPVSGNLRESRERWSQIGVFLRSRCVCRTRPSGVESCLIADRSDLRNDVSHDRFGPDGHGRDYTAHLRRP